ncbi:MAG: class II aldolase/adducin family protein [Caulobacteraceae bacterium]|nr:class II aldolase/adducin family protein [Caulobacteraceae bacterium]
MKIDPVEQDLREDIVATMRLMDERGLNRGTSGNVSARYRDGLLVTPSGVLPGDLTPATIVRLDADGNSPEGSMRPSSEWKMHAGLLARRPDFGAVVHCHARHATILACAGKTIPALHYMVGVSGKPEVPLAPYRTFGSLELAEVVADAMDGGSACLMANHGLITAAPRLDRALAIAEEMEEQAAVYWGTLAIGGPNLLTGEQMDDVMLRFKSYGQARPAKT